MEVSGVRNSWLASARNSSCSRRCWEDRVMSRMTTTASPAPPLCSGCPLASYQQRVPSAAGRANSRLNVSPRAARACGVSAGGSGRPCASSGTRGASIARGAPVAPRPLPRRALLSGHAFLPSPLPYGAPTVLPTSDTTDTTPPTSDTTDTTPQPLILQGARGGPVDGAALLAPHGIAETDEAVKRGGQVGLRHPAAPRQLVGRRLPQIEQRPQHQRLPLGQSGIGRPRRSRAQLSRDGAGAPRVAQTLAHDQTLRRDVVQPQLLAVVAVAHLDHRQALA